MAVTTGSLYTVGGLLALAATAAYGERVAHPTALGLLSCLAVVVGLVVLAGRARIPRTAYQGIVAAGSAVITAGVVCAGPRSAVGFSCLFVLVAIDCFFFSVAAAAAQMTLLLLGVGVAFQLTAVPLGARLLVPSATVGVAAVVSWLVRRADLAEVDALTGLANRRGFDRAVDAALSRASREGRPLVVAVLDLDRVTAVPDQLGRAARDHLLQSTARTWSGDLRSGAVLARTAADELALVLPDTTASDAETLVERLRTGVPGRRVCPVGLAPAEPGDTRSLLVSRAEAALYDAKRGGRNGIGRADRHAARESELRDALANGEMFLAYQRIVRVHDGSVAGVEALVRWLHPEHGVLGPDTFVPDAESGPVVHELGDWVCSHAFAEAATWPVPAAVAGHAALPRSVLAVNVAGPELRTPDYAQRFLAHIRRAGLAPDAVVLEVTETTLDADFPEVVDTLAEIRAAGVRIALDDFGTGWSSLSRLDRLPVDILKIDQSFVSRLADADADPTMFAAIVSFGRALGLSVVAEGVETPAQAAAVAAAGCDLAQGHHYGFPEPALC